MKYNFEITINLYIQSLAKKNDLIGYLYLLMHIHINRWSWHGVNCMSNESTKVSFI